MEPLVVLVAGLLAVGGGVVVLRSFGPGYRVGRLLASTPTTTIEQAEAWAAAGTPHYVRIDGRLDSAEDFPDENARPLVYRRRRMETRHRGHWDVVGEEVQVVPFEVREGLGVLAIDGQRLAEGLIVLPREAMGTAAEVADRLPPGTPPDLPVRYRVEQVSAVEHATVLGVPERQADGTTRLTAGLGRPLVLSTVERTEAMQLLAGGRRGRPLAALALLVAGLGLLALGLAWSVVRLVAAVIVPSPVLGASPTATPAGAGDTRSAGEGPGLVGSPLLAIGLVVAIATLAVIATLIYVRLTGGRTPEDHDRI